MAGADLASCSEDLTPANDAMPPTIDVRVVDRPRPCSSNRECSPMGRVCNGPFAHCVARDQEDWHFHFICPVFFPECPIWHT